MIPRVAIGTAVLLWAAAWNGYPLFFFDSFQYVPLPFGAELPVYRTAAYGLFTAPGKWTGSLWTVVVVQAALVAVMLDIGATALAPPRRAPPIFGLLLLAAVVGGLPWYAGQVVADVFAGVTILGMIVLLLLPDRLDRGRRLALAVIVALATSLHTSHIGLAAGLLLLGLVGLAARRFWGHLPRVAPALPAACLATAVLLAAGANWVATGRAFLVQAATVQTLALYIENGMAKRYLDAVCPGSVPAPHALCAHRDRLPPTANEFLWGHSPFRSLGGFTGMEAEARAIVHGATALFPVELARQSLVFTGRQFVMVNLGDGLVPMTFLMRDPIAAHYPHELRRFEAARQQRGEIGFSAIAPFERPVYLLSVLALAVIGALCWRAGDRTAALLAGLLLLALIGNAVICGAMSNPNLRYQGRIAWLPLAAVLVLAYRLRHATALETSSRAAP